MTHAKRFGKYVRRRREQTGLGLRQFARRAKLPPSQVFRIEAGADPQLSTLLRLSKGFREPLHRFLEAYNAQRKPLI
jgi:transcriptional regulator with XRE-family HTH domain